MLPIILGILAGIVTGLTPGIHINLVATMLVASAPLLLAHTTVVGLCSFIIAMSVTHTFLDSIPSIFLGAPDAATALGVLPGHRLLIDGKGRAAVAYTVIGSLGASLLCIIGFPIFLIIVRLLYPLISGVMGYLLLTVIAFMVLREEHRTWALLVLLLAGALGILVLNHPTLENPLFPMLSGLFGASTLLLSLRETTALPAQTDQPADVETRVAAKAITAGQASGFLTAMLPGLGAATAAILSLQVVRDLGDEGYLILQGSINTVNFILSLATLLVLDKARNGAIVAVKELLAVGPAHVLLFLAVTLVSAGSATVLAVLLGRGFARAVAVLPYRALILSVLLLILLLAFVLSSWTGLLVLVVAVAIGILPPIVKVARVHAMGCILIPVTLFFLNI